MFVQPGFHTYLILNCKIMTSGSIVKEERSIEDEIKYICHYCLKRFYSVKVLKFHLTRFHSEDFHFVSKGNIFEYSDNVCKWCKKYFSTIYKMRDHVKTKHSEYFSRLPPLKRVRRHNFPCKHCHKSFSSIYKLRDHVYSRHAEYADELPPLQRLRGSAITCEVCEKQFSTINNLRKHYTTKHPDRQDLLPPPKKTKGPFNCTLCDRNFCGNHSFRRHQKSHNINYNIRNKYKCPLCEFSVHGHIKLIYSHFEEKHNIRVVINHFEFDSMKAYEVWKSDIEKNTRSFFIRSNQNKQKQAFYLKCHRSGCFKSRSQGIRHLKSRGSNKINGFCPASILVKSKGEKIIVRYVETHIGHEQDIKYLPLNKEDKQFCTTKIAANVSFDEILLEIQSDNNASQQERRKLITKKDLTNIRRSFIEANASEDLTHHKDVLFYKPRKIILSDYPELGDNDFAIALMSHEQQNILKSSTNMISINGTQSMSKHNFDIFVITILGQEKDCIYPAGFYITTKSNESTLRIFFNLVQQAIGKQLKPNVLLMDTDEYLYSAWIHVMGEPEKFFYCPWIVTRQWTKQLSKLPKQAATNAFSNLLSLLWSPYPYDIFKQLLDSTIKSLMSSTKTSEFGQYFENSFSNNYIKWACFYRDPRVGCKIMFYMERLLNLMSYIIPNGLRGSNLRALVNSLHHYLTNDVLLHSGSLKQINDIVNTSFSPHEKLLKRNLPNNIHHVNDNFIISSIKGNNYNYFCIQRKLLECTCTITLCEKCILCPHMFECSCIESILSGICEHIHAVNMQINSLTSQEIHIEEITTDQNLWNIEYEVVILDSDVESLLDSNNMVEANLNGNCNTDYNIEPGQRVMLEFDINETNDPTQADETENLET